ncbi:MAG TPA: endolytic transglycosylase MltG [Elusimicrobiota bacterium]|nr:endolytic transglycosylase MltG [Elusimicrobiota bacterium]
MRKGLYFLVGAAVLFAAAAGFFKPGAPVKVEIPPGLSATQTAQMLKEDGVIGSVTLFRAASKILRADRSLKPGLYYFRKSMPILEVLRRLERGSDGIRIMVPEGFSARQIAERLEANGVCKTYDFMRYVERRRLEGYLFPSTYYFDANQAPAQVAARMTQEFQDKMASVYDSFTPKPALTLAQAVTLASIVQREAYLESERPMIAGVYLNRLKLRMRLQADPTVQYALGYWKKELTVQDLKIDSPYNTYIHYGLPPGPICSPGVMSLLAVLRPADTKDLYFVANDKGGHIFSETNAEQNAAKAEVRKSLERAKKDGGAADSPQAR